MVCKALILLLIEIDNGLSNEVNVICLGSTGKI